MSQDGGGVTLWRLLGLVAPLRKGVAAGSLLAFAALAAGVGLVATAAYAISRAALVTSYVEIEAVLAGVRVFALSRAALRYLERYVAHDVSFQLLARLRAWFYAAIEPLAPAVLWRHRGGDLLSRIVGDVETLEQFAVRVLMPAAAALLTGVTASLFLALFDPRLGLLLLAAMAAIGLIVPVLGRRATGEPARAQVEGRAELAASVVDGVQGLADLLAAGQDRRYLDGLENIGRRLDRAERRLALARGLAAAATAALTSLALVAVLLVAGPLVSQGRLQGVYLAMLPLTALAALEAVAPLPAAIEHLERSLAAAARLFELTDAQPAVTEPAVSSPLPRTGAIELENVRFAYESGQAPVLAGLDLHIEPGERLTILGPSGAGKTTLFNLLLRFWQPQAGCIRIGGRDLRECAGDEVRELFGVVAQDTHLFGGTVRANLLLGRPDASETDIVAACRQARLHDTIERLPRGYDTWIGENGLLLSGGERQRLAIARAILKDAPVLLLDEPTAHLDPETADEVLGALQELMEGRTVVAVGHQATGPAPGGRVLVLEGGRLREPVFAQPAARAAG